jgi:hypothetical protein
VDLAEASWSSSAVSLLYKAVALFALMERMVREAQPRWIPAAAEVAVGAF